MKKAATPGGNRLRSLREACGRTQLEVELDASLGIGYLQRVEAGKVRFPERDTLERILAALSAPYSERRDILELFGYVVDSPLPQAAEIREAVELCQHELNSAVFPAYLLDCAHYLLAGNPYLAKLFEMQRWAGQADRVSMLRAMFDPAFGICERIVNPEAFFPAQIRATRYQMRLFQGEVWVSTLIDAMLTLPLFARYWSAVSDEPSRATLAGRPLIPLMIRSLEGDTLSFRLTSEPFAQDRRFRMIYYLPADSLTMQQCVLWTQAVSQAT